MVLLSILACVILAPFVFRLCVVCLCVFMSVYGSVSLYAFLCSPAHSFPLAVWFAGPVPMFLSTIALVSFLHWFDHLPDSVPPDFAAQFERHHSDEVHTGNSK